MIKNRKEALCQFLGEDMAEIEESRYHAGRTSIPVYTPNDSYYCCTKGNQKPATHRDGFEWDWKEIPDNYINQFGWKIWKA